VRSSVALPAAAGSGVAAQRRCTRSHDRATYFVEGRFSLHRVQRRRVHGAVVRPRPKQAYANADHGPRRRLSNPHVVPEVVRRRFARRLGRRLERARSAIGAAGPATRDERCAPAADAVSPPAAPAAASGRRRGLADSAAAVPHPVVSPPDPVALPHPVERAAQSVMFITCRTEYPKRSGVRRRASAVRGSGSQAGAGPRTSACSSE
jgi:hypothetical protein